MDKKKKGQVALKKGKVAVAKKKISQKPENFIRDFRGRVVVGNFFKKNDSGGVDVVKKPVPKKLIETKVVLSDKSKRQKQKLIKERKRLYSEKYRIYDKYFDEEEGIGFEKGDALKILKKIQGIENKIALKNEKIKNYSVKYLKQKSAKKKWQSRIAYLKKNYDKIDDKYKLSVISEISSIQDIINELNIAIDKPVERIKGQIKSIFDENKGEISEDVPVWQATDRVMDIIRTGNYKTIDVAGEVYSTDNIISIKWQLDELYISITTSLKRKSRTPFVTITINDTTKHITVYEAKY